MCLQWNKVWDNYSDYSNRSDYQHSQQQKIHWLHSICSVTSVVTIGWQWKTSHVSLHPIVPSKDGSQEKFIEIFHFWTLSDMKNTTKVYRHPLQKSLFLHVQGGENSRLVTGTHFFSKVAPGSSRPIILSQNGRAPLTAPVARLFFPL